MRNPLDSLRNFIRDKSTQARDVARKARENVGPLYSQARNGESRDEEREQYFGDWAQGSSGPESEDAEFDGEEQGPSDATQEEEHDSDMRRFALWEQSDGTSGRAESDGREKSTEHDEQQAESLGHAIGSLIDNQPEPVQRLHAVFQQDGRRHERHYLVVTAEEGDASPEPSEQEPDVLLDVPDLSVDEIDLEVEELKARVALHAEVAELVNIDVGAEVEIGEVDLTIKGVHAEALLKVHLQEVRHILTEALETLRERPELVTKALESVEESADEVGDVAGEGGALSEAADAAAGEATDAAEEATDTAQGAAEEASETPPSIEAGSDVSYGEKQEKKKEKKGEHRPRQ